MNPEDGLRVVIRPDFLSYAQGRAPAATSEEPPARFLSGRIPGRLQVAGHVSQRRLLEAALSSGWTVWAASGAALGVPDPTENPSAAVYRMLGCRSPGSVGGWHRLTADHADLLGGEAAGALWHPVVRLMGFVRGLEPSWLWRVMGHVVDPRWYSDPDRPNSDRRLLSRLGLFPQRRMSLAAIAVRRCWLRGLEASKPDCGPDAFVHREYLRVLEAGGDQGRAALRASRLFASVLRSVWLAHLYHGEPDEFAPHLRLPDDASAAYRSHAARVYASTLIDGRRAAG